MGGVIECVRALVYGFAYLTGGLLIVFGGFPCSLNIMCVHEGCIIVVMLQYCSYALNAAIVLVTLHATSTLAQFYAWEAAYIGWAGAMSLLFLSSLFAGKSQDEFTKLLLRPFGVVQVKEAGSSYMWSFPLLALLGAQLGYFIAEWFLNAQPDLSCTAPALVPPPVNTSANATDAPATNQTTNSSFEVILAPLVRCPPPLIAWDKTATCCRIVEDQFNLTKLLTAIGGNVLAGYAVIKTVASILLWADDSVKGATKWYQPRASMSMLSSVKLGNIRSLAAEDAKGEDAKGEEKA